MQKDEQRSEVMRLENIGVYYWKKSGLFRQKRFWVLNDVSFEIRKGETLGIIGRNGAGKSTLLRLLAGIIAPDKGNLISNGGRASLLSLQIGFTPHLSGRENAIFSGMLLGMKRREIEAKLPEIIEFSELEQFIDDPIRTYSSGMKARLGFAISLHAPTELLLIDEVIGVGDAAFREKSVAAMRERIKSNLTVAIVSHMPGIIKDICDRVIWIENGRTQEQGSPDQIVGNYETFIRKHKFGLKLQLDKLITG
jgi:lipopolysaccharide transport system ATP-binding protein